jgi:shikimate kinase
MSTAVLDMPTLTPTRAAQAPARLDRIVLTGFMGSGKSTVGALLAETLGWKFLDLDREIEQRTGRTIPQIFAESGEQKFRQAETSALASVLGQRHVVIALGGGAPEELGNRLLLEQTPRTTVIYLAAEFAMLVERCRKQTEDPTATARPVLADEAVAAARFAKRKPHYERVASFTVETANETAETCVAAVLELLQTRG